jgi:hypothetical protein
LNLQEKTTGWLDWALYLALFALVCIFRVSVLQHFGFKWTDGDQVIMWHGVKDFAEGHFYETRFYGQSYNTMLESILALPLYLFGVDASFALPIVTSILAIFPFLLISFFVFIKKSSKVGLVILSIPLILPTNYSLITTMPRGFVTGIFVSSFMFLFIHNKSSLAGFFLSAFLMIVGYSINPNAILFSIPCFAYIFLNNIKNKSFYVYSFMGLVLGGTFHFLLNLFYKIHPNYNLHRYTLTYEFKNVVTGLNNLSLYFKDVGIVFAHGGMIIFMAFIIFALLFLLKKDMKSAVVVAIVPILILLSFSVSKIHDALDSIFYSYSRMYLALPLALALAISFIQIKKRFWIFYLYLLVPISCFAYNFSYLKHKIDVETNTGKNHMVSIKEVEVVKQDCYVIKQLCTQHDIDFIIIAFDWRSTLSTYGCSSCIEDFPKTLFPFYERRTWRMLEDENMAYKNVLIIDMSRPLESLYTGIEKVENKDGFFIIKNNTKKTFKLLESLQIEYRPFK